MRNRTDDLKAVENAGKLRIRSAENNGDRTAVVRNNSRTDCAVTAGRADRETGVDAVVGGIMDDESSRVIDCACAAVEIEVIGRVGRET